MKRVYAIVGAGQAGGWAAVTLRQEGFAGRIVLIGDEPHLPYERPPLSKSMLTSAETLPPQSFRPATRYDELDIELRLGVEVEAIDPAEHQLRFKDGSGLAYDRLLLATGGEARRLAVPGAELVSYIRTYDDALRLRATLTASRNVVCVGAGVIGLECASSARAFGCKVTVIEPAASPMARALPPGPAQALRNIHEAAGITFRFGTGVAAIVRTLAGLRLICEDGTELLADAVIAGIGMVRHTRLARQAGLAVEGGILVDEFGRTDAEDIYAAGDVTAFWHPALNRRLMLETWQHAQNHGIAVGRSMAGKPSSCSDTPWFWSDQQGYNLQVAGSPLEGQRETVRVLASGGQLSLYLDNDNRLMGAVGLNAGRDIRMALSLIQRGAALDPSLLADPAIPLNRTIARVAA